MGRKGEVEVVLVGNELLKGERRDAHLAFIGNVLGGIGVYVTGAHTIGDDREGIAALLRDRLDDARAIIVAGGLGPTHDDVTREGVADALGLPLEFDEEEWGRICRIFERAGLKADESNRRQAYFPRGAMIIPNPKGTAAGFIAERKKTLVAVLPGPPRELNPMMEAHVVERVDALFGRRPVFKQTYRTTGIGESAMTPLVSPIFEDFAGDFVVSSLPHLGGVDLVLTQRPDRDPDGLAARAGQFERRLRKVLGDKVYAIGNETLEEVVGGLLTKRGETVAVAESLTGGLIGKRLTDTPGSSRYFLADVVAYSNDAKEKWLGVAPKSLEAYGAVSEAVCREMALGVRSRTGATWSLATTGIAGPDGGTKDKPVGLTYFGVAWGGGDEVRHRVFPGGRDDVRDRVAFASLFLLYRRLVNS